MPNSNALELSSSQVLICYAKVPQTLEKDNVTSLLQMLSRAEQEKASRFHFEKDRVLYIASHALLRSFISRILGNKGWDIRINEFGKPEIEVDLATSRMHVSLSHTRGMVLCGGTRLYEIGVDVEFIDHDQPIIEIARSYFDASEIKQILNPDGLIEASRFYQI